MPASLDALEPGDIVEIKYHLWRPAVGNQEDACQEDVVERWISAHVIACERGTWPLARLADGQMTEIRPFMTWRSIMRAKRRSVAIAA
jgi:hypothetical protein